MGVSNSKIMYHNVYLDSDEDDGRQTGDKEQDVASNVTLSSAQPQASKSQDEAAATVAEKPKLKRNCKRAKSTGSCAIPL